jgi:hypothetical protein
LSDDYVSLELVKRINYLGDAMKNGLPKDWTDYQALRGQIIGLEYAIGVIAELKKKMEEEENK